VSEDTPPPETPKPANKQRGQLAAALSQHVHAILVGVFTLASSIISALLGYYFAHADRQSMMALEYDKLRAEHTLEIARNLSNAESALENLVLVSKESGERYCDLAKRLTSTHAELAKVAQAPPLGSLTLSDTLIAMERAVGGANTPEDLRASLAARIKTMKADHEELDKKIRDSWKRDEDARNSLHVDTAATLRIYYRDRAMEFSKLALDYDAAGRAPRELVLKNGECGLEKEWKAALDTWVAWSVRASTFSESLGIAINPTENR
jgi:hypothetical protein